MSTVRFEAGDLTFEWDDAKARANRKKHGVSFEEAATVFLDPLALIFDDPDPHSGEVRMLILGLSIAVRMVLVVHVVRDDDVLRIISARPPTRRERAKLEEG
jgi:uncharacterized DUF497 family protein